MNTINISRLESLEDVHNLIRDDFSKIKTELEASSDEIYICINDIGLGIINLSALTMLTCVLSSIRKKYEYPFIGYIESQEKELFFADPYKASFLKATNFISLTQDLRIIQWHLQKNIPDLEFNPNTGIKLIDIPSIAPSVFDYYDADELFNKDEMLYNIIQRRYEENSSEIDNVYENAKTTIKNEIKSYIFNDICNVFTDREGRNLKNNVISYTSEIILNSFIHGRVNPFFAVQRTGKKITVTICDDGVGLINSFFKLHGETLNCRQALINACKHRIQNSYGIFDVLVSVLGIDKPSFVMNDIHHGFVTISSDSHILTITRNNFRDLIENPEKLKIFDTNQSIRGVRISLDILIK
jgi:hypothetical protein